MRKKITAFFLILIALSVFSLDVSLVKVDIKEALYLLSNQAKVPIIYPPGISGEVTVELRNVSIETALNVILTGTPYDWFKRDGYYVVYSLQSLPITLGQVHVIELRNISADQAMEYLKDYEDYVSKAGPSAIAVFSGGKVYSKVKEILEKVDLPGRQLVIWYRVIFFSDYVQRQLQRVISSKAVSFSDELSFISPKDEVFIEDVIGIVKSERESSLISGVVPIYENREAKINLIWRNKKFDLSLLMKGSELLLVLNSGGLKTQTKIKVEKGRKAALRFKNGLVELYFGEVSPVVVEKSEKEEDKYWITGLMEVKTGTTTVYGAGVEGKVIGNLKLDVWVGKGVDYFAGVTASDKRYLSYPLVSYGWLGILIDKTLNPSFRGGLGLGLDLVFGDFEIFGGGGVYSNLESYDLMTSGLIRWKGFYIRGDYLIGECEHYIVRLGMRW